VQATKKSFETFDWLKGFIKQERQRIFPDDPTFFAEELEVCDEMVRILPEKISRMHYMGQSFKG
jgi:hypothetical protein